MSIISDNEINRVYNIISQKKICYGLFHKTLFHIHTPASYDYNLFKAWDVEEYRGKLYEEVLKICVDRKIVPAGMDINNIHSYEKFDIYEDEKEFLSFLLLADALLKEEIEIAVVCDHNTIGGIEKLKIAIEELHSAYRYKTFCHVICGIEVSCVDKIHVIGIFEGNILNKEKIISWINENIITIKDGVLLTSYDVMNFFDKMGAITYMAHLNTSDIFKEQKFLSGGYKNKLLSSQFVNYIGISEIDKKTEINNFISKYTKNKPQYVLDNDSHDIDSIIKNIFWIKGKRINFNLVKEAFIDFDISIKYTDEKLSRQNIEAIFVDFEENAFLKGTIDKAPLCIKFSDSLNCFIGGRGTGKSSIIQLLDYALGQKCNSKDMLNFLCNHGNTWVLCNYDDKQFLILLLLPCKENPEDDILRCFKQNLDDRYRFSYYFSPEEVESITRENYIEVFEVLKKNEKIEYKKLKNKKTILNKLYDTQYSVNELVKTADSDKINNFIYKKMFENRNIAKLSNVVRYNGIDSMKYLLGRIKKILENREFEVLRVIEPFNETQKDILRIVYSQEKKVTEPNINGWIDTSEIEKEYNIDKDNIVSYLLNIYDRIGIFDLLNLALNNRNFSARTKYPIIGFANEFNKSLVEKNKKQINENNQWLIVSNIFNNFVNCNNVNMINEYIKQYLEEMETFSLEFNINSKETATNSSSNFKDIRILSLGQKVVAMLDFIIGYGEFSNDCRPLIIDQPEDNLDNQYIYKNLVKQLRQVKIRRQIIIATHNSTIVTNAMADNVCIMDSDGNHGWVSKTGYPGEPKIKKAIVNILEGGKNSFNHKIKIYNNIL